MAVSAGERGDLRVAANEGHHDLESDQDDDDPLEELGAADVHAVGELAVDALEGLELAEDGGIPLGEVEALGGEAVEAREVLVAEEFQGVVDALEEEGGIDLVGGDVAQVAVEAVGEQAQERGWALGGLAGALEVDVEAVVEVTHLEEL